MLNVWVRGRDGIVNAAEISSLAGNSTYRINHGESRAHSLYPDGYKAEQKQTDSLLAAIAAAATGQRAYLVEFNQDSGYWSTRQLEQQPAA